MIAFVTIGTNNLEISSKFYDKILFPLGIIRIESDERYVGYAKKNTPNKIELYIMQPYNKSIASIGNGTMIAFLAESKEIVNKFYVIGLENGALDEGAPGPRHRNDYYAYIRDLDGNKICAYSKNL